MKIIFFITFLAGFLVPYKAEEIWKKLSSGRTEVYFSFSKSDAQNLKEILPLIYVDHITADSVYAYANREQFLAFHSRNIAFSLQLAPSMKYKDPLMLSRIDIKALQGWDFYPTYDAYVDMMFQFEIAYPDICKVVEIGTLSSGRKILALRITDNIQLREAEPEFLYTSSIHGDETTGYILLLRLADHLLNNYGSNEDITSLLQATDIYINPLANPDGTFAGGNHTVYGATRTNANGVDINRNFPDPEDGPHPDGNAWQEETVFFMDFAESHNFVMSANIHGGAEVCNYPWDTWSRRHADEQWWQLVCREYADTAQAYSPSGYMSAYNNGITNGYDWYSISGGRQDYMNYFQQCREFTLEISNIKTLPSSLLPAYWEYNYRSLLNYMEQVNYGLKGLVTDFNTGDPLKAEVRFTEHDADSSMVFSSIQMGNYHRPAATGNYQLKISTPGYIPAFLNNVAIENYNSIIIDVGLQQANFYADFIAGKTLAETGSSVSFINLSYGEPDSYQWYFEGGIPEGSTMQNPPSINYQNPGKFDVNLTVYKDGDSSSLLFEDYIRIAAFYFMNSETVESCSGYFFDAGGMNYNYGNNQHDVMHFIPDTPGKQLVFFFEDFNIEFDENCDYDWLKIYNGPSVNDELIGTFCGSTIPDTIMANNPSGAVTFEFYSDFSENRSGWMACFYCDSNVSVIENEAVKYTYSFYPNPVTDDRIFLKTADNIEWIQIFDISGSIRLNTLYEGEGSLYVGALEEGLYIIRFFSEEKISSSKLIIY